jgi:hypothetical protein
MEKMRQTRRWISPPRFARFEKFRLDLTADVTLQFVIIGF